MNGFTYSYTRNPEKVKPNKPVVIKMVPEEVMANEFISILSTKSPTLPGSPVIKRRYQALVQKLEANHIISNPSELFFAVKNPIQFMMGWKKEFEETLKMKKIPVYKKVRGTGEVEKSNEWNGVETVMEFIYDALVKVRAIPLPRPLHSQRNLILGAYKYKLRDNGTVDALRQIIGAMDEYMTYTKDLVNVTIEKLLLAIESILKIYDSHINLGPQNGIPPFAEKINEILKREYKKIITRAKSGTTTPASLVRHMTWLTEFLRRKMDVIDTNKRSEAVKLKSLIEVLHKEASTLIIELAETSILKRKTEKFMNDRILNNTNKYLPSLKNVDIELPLIENPRTKFGVYSNLVKEYESLALQQIPAENKRNTALNAERARAKNQQEKKLRAEAAERARASRNAKNREEKRLRAEAEQAQYSALLTRQNRALSAPRNMYTPQANRTAKNRDEKRLRAAAAAAAAAGAAAGAHSLYQRKNPQNRANKSSPTTSGRKNNLNIFHNALEEQGPYYTNRKIKPVKQNKQNENVFTQNFMKRAGKSGGLPYYTDKNTTKLQSLPYYPSPSPSFSPPPGQGVPRQIGSSSSSFRAGNGRYSGGQGLGVLLGLGGAALASRLLRKKTPARARTTRNNAARTRDTAAATTNTANTTRNTAATRTRTNRNRVQTRTQTGTIARKNYSRMY